MVRNIVIALVTGSILLAAASAGFGEYLLTKEGLFWIEFITSHFAVIWWFNHDTNKIIKSKLAKNKQEEDNKKNAVVLNLDGDGSIIDDLKSISYYPDSTILTLDSPGLPPELANQMRTSIKIATEKEKRLQDKQDIRKMELKNEKLQITKEILELEEIKKQKLLNEALSKGAEEFVNGGYTPLKDAAIQAFEECRKDGKSFHLALSGSTDDATEEHIIDYFAIALVHQIPIYGKRPPATNMEKLDQNEINKRGNINGNNATFTKYNMPSPKYIKLAVDPPDLEKAIEYLKSVVNPNTEIEELKKLAKIAELENIILENEINIKKLDEYNK